MQRFRNFGAIVLIPLTLVACGDDSSQSPPDGGTVSCAAQAGRFGVQAGMSNEVLEAVLTKSNGALLSAGNASGGAWLIEIGADKTVAWQKTYADTSGTGPSFSVAAMEATSDGGAIVAGISSTAGASGDSDWWVAKLDAAGGIAWQKAINFTRQDSASAVRQTSDGGFVVAGYVNGKAGVVKLDANGTIGWQKLYRLPRTPASLVPWDIRSTREGGFVVTGTLPGEQSPGWVMMLDSAGAIQWLKSYAGGGGSIYPTGDGGYVMAGPVGYEPGGAWVIKLDAAGDVQWQKRYGEVAGDAGAPNSYGIAAVWPTYAGGYAVAGRLRRTETQAWLIGLDANGAIQWQQAYGRDQSSTEAFALARTADCGYAIAGAFGPWGSAGRALLMKVGQTGDLPGATFPKTLSFVAETQSGPAQTETAASTDATATAMPATATATSANISVTDLPQ